MNTHFTDVEKTLFVPLLGRIYCSTHFPHLLYDRKALDIGNTLDSKLTVSVRGNQYTHIASAVRSANMDRYIQHFMKQYQDGIIVQIGCGLETTFHRNDDGIHQWIELDLPEVIRYRKQIIGETERDRCMEGDATSEDWLKTIREQYPTQPLLITASGVFYYFTEEMVKKLMQHISRYGKSEVIFDTVNGAGMKQMHKQMKAVGHEATTIYFYVDKGREFAHEVGATLLDEEKFYLHTSLHGMNLKTRLLIRCSDWLNMVKMIHLKFD